MAGPALGWPMSTPEQWTALAAIGAGTFCCSAAANALNQRHEIPRDSRMVRTRGRPLVQGRATADQARNFAIAAGGLGTASLLAGCGPIPAVLGFANIALYAGIYTRMKPLSEWNTNAGAIVGGIPPLMGWAAAGGSLAEPEAALLFASLYLWQVRLSFSVSLSLSLSLSRSLALELTYQHHPRTHCFLHPSRHPHALHTATVTPFLPQFPHFYSLAYNHRKDYARGGFQMMPCNDPSGSRTARWTLWHAGCLTALPFVAAASNVTSSMFLFEGCVLNAGGLFFAYRFLKRPSQPTAQKVFFYSLVYLPLLLAGLVFHSKRWEQEKRDSTADSGTIAHGIEQWREAGRQICLHERGGREWVFDKIGMVSFFILLYDYILHNYNSIT